MSGTASLKYLLICSHLFLHLLLTCGQFGNAQIQPQSQEAQVDTLKLESDLDLLNLNSATFTQKNSNLNQKQQSDNSDAINRSQQLGDPLAETNYDEASASKSNSKSVSLSLSAPVPETAPTPESSSREANSASNDQLTHDQVHKLMSIKDLRRTFQVDSHDQVPEYQILQLTVQADGSHSISPISDLGEFQATQFSSSSQAPTSRQLHQADRQNPESKPKRLKRSSDQSTGDNNTNTASGAINSRASKPIGSRSDAKVNLNLNQDSSEQNVKLQDQPLVMRLSTFGRDFKLRLKRNVDFQQRIKDMKMFMAESTQDGQLRYTEIKTNPQQHQHRQEPHKRAAEAAQEQEDQLQSTAMGTDGKTSAKTPPTAPTTGAPSDSSHSSATGSNANANANSWNVGSTYHDEDNLAALLIDQDTRTGQLRVDGTIGNDFVIKPMPRATIEALESRRQNLRKTQDREAASSSTTQSPSGGQQKGAANNAIGVESLANIELERSKSPRGERQAQVNLGSRTGAIDEASIIHMHDDDPHDDDEMFLDEDEALELAHLQSAAQAVESHHTTNSNSTTNANDQQTGKASFDSRHHQKLPQTARVMSKSASERKWKKYRKLMAQTQVPKLNNLPASGLDSVNINVNNENQGQSTRDTVASSSGQATSGLRARRHAHHEEVQPSATILQVSHHIIYRQKPSSEGSSSEHQHSFMASPQVHEPSAASMERMAIRFAPQRVAKRSASEANNVLDGDQSRTGAVESDADEDADFAEDPLGGQFYLEPGSVTGFERAGYSDWSLVGDRRFGSPPYAFERSLNGSSVHKQMSKAPGNSTAHLRYRRQARGSMRVHGSQVRHKRQAPDTVWPEVLLVVDYDSFLLHGGDSRDVKRYFVSFWNGVDLRYKLLVHPHIRISLAGMIVAKDRDATPYLERNRLRAPNADAVDAAGALTDMGKYLYREDRLPTYDLAVVITKLDMCRRRYEGGRCNRGTAGFAYVGGACVVNKRLEKVNSVAIIEDSGGFSGIIVAAHEVGHLLGCVHDGSPPPSYLGGPGATHCPWEDGFIMSDLRHTERGFRWSQCSVEQFKHFLNGETATCLYNYPHESQMLHRLLPGTMLSLDDQCKRDRGTNACFKDARVCAQLFCFDSASGYCVSYRPAAEGSPCGEGQVCRNGKCVGEIENIIPDYTHQSQTIVARRPSHSVTRLADNGLSASSTSTATSSPDSKLQTIGQGVNSMVPQISSRMDTFPVDGPISNSVAAYPFGGRTVSSFSASGSSSSSMTGEPGEQNSLLMLQGSSPSAMMTRATQAAPTRLAKSRFVSDKTQAAKLEQSKVAANLQSRNGRQNVRKGANHHDNIQPQQPATVKRQQNLNQKQTHNKLNVMQSNQHQHYPISTFNNIDNIINNNLLTSASTSSTTKVMSPENKSTTTSSHSETKRLRSNSQLRQSTPSHESRNLNRRATSTGINPVYNSAQTDTIRATL